MIKSGLKIYKNNIWEVFALLGFISIGLLIAIFALGPVFNSLITNSIAKVASAVTIEGKKLDLVKFSGEVQKLINQMDWSNPIRAIKILFNNNGLFEVIVKALKECGVDSGQITQISNLIHDVCHDFIFSSSDIIFAIIGIVGATTLVGCIFIRALIQARSTKDHNIGKFILSFVINFIAVALIFFLIILSLVSISSPLLYLALIGIFILLLLLSLVISILIYKGKGLRVIDLLNFKSFGSLLLSSLIIVAISGVVIVLVFIFSDFIALYIALPLLIVTNTVIENIAIKYVTDFKISN